MLSRRLIFVAVFAILGGGLALWLSRSRPQPVIAVDRTGEGSRISRELAQQLAALEARERNLDETVWSRELLAQDCGRTFESLWDTINAASNKLEVAAEFEFGELVLGTWTKPRLLPYGIELREPSAPSSILSPAAWRHRLREFARAGWQLERTEFRHTRFETDSDGQPSRSRFYFTAHLTNPRCSERAILEGDLLVDWAPRASPEGLARVKRIDATGLTIKTRRGEPVFPPILSEKIAPPEHSLAIDPLIVHDLDGDGFSEIILASKNLVYRRHGPENYKPEPLCRHPPGSVLTALIADFDADGAADFLAVTPKALLLFNGSPQGTFAEPGRIAWRSGRELGQPMALTCGDIDLDGDLDVFLGQYKSPYDAGQMPAPYWDANDGYPAYLLKNDGHGQFTDVTEAAGLGKNRRRRTYSASFVNLNSDPLLDLAVISDFAGIDLYRNLGRGRFAEVTREWIPEPHAFGMSHALADFNADGRLDLLMIGMPSPTVDRLEHLGLWRPDAAEVRAMRSRMTFGNRLYLARPQGGFEQTDLGENLARSGWSWGCSAFDFDNDGFPEVYIANGMESRQSVQDYEGQYWLHDTYVANSTDNPAAYLYLKSKVTRLRGHGQSYGGYEKNRLYWNRGGASFLEIAHLMGVALESDSRNVVTDDLDGDGRVDLLVTTYEAWPGLTQTLHVFKNTLEGGGNWIGFRLPERAGQPSPVGARVILHYRGRAAVRQLVNGDSFRSQHANTLHFGLGQAEHVDRAEIRWPNGESMVLVKPELNRYHVLY